MKVRSEANWVAHCEFAISLQDAIGMMASPLAGSSTSTVPAVSEFTADWPPVGRLAESCLDNGA